MTENEPINLNNIQVQHNFQEQQFYIEIAGHLAVLDYTFVDPEKVDIDHTFVPPIFRGKGIAELLLESAVQWMEQEGFQIRASCRYAHVKLSRQGKLNQEKLNQA